MATAEAVARPSLAGRVAAGWSAARPAEWLKNGFVVAPLVFSGRYDESGAVVDSALAFAGFCAMASAGYLVNDVRDRAYDRAHPTKRRRAVASGRLSPRAALTQSAVLAVAGLALAAWSGVAVLGLVAAYAVLAVGYSELLKRVVIVDVMALGAFFLLRVEAGSVAIDVVPSEWLLACTAMLALFLGFTKRRQELTTVDGPPGASRPVLDGYSLPFIDQMVSLTATATVVSYAIYAIDSPLVGGSMLATAPPVLYGVFRYLHLLYVRNDPRSVAVIATHDPGVLAALVVWAVVVVVVIMGR